MFATCLVAFRHIKGSKGKGMCINFRTSTKMMNWCFTPLSTLFKSYGDEGMVIMKGSVQ